MPHALLLTALGGILLVCVPAYAAIYRVGNDAACTHSTIQAAIDVATAAAGADEIRIRADTYADTALRIGDDADALRLVGGFAGCASDSPQPQTWSTLFGTTGHPILTIEGAADVTLVSLVLAGATTGYEGGGIWYSALAGQLTLVDTAINDNAAAVGGGILIRNPDGDAGPEAVQLVLRGRSVLIGNQAASGDGGGIYCSRATVRVLDEANLQFNQAWNGDGGGIYASDCRIEIASRGSPADLGALSHNQAMDGRGGGLHLSGARASAVVYPVHPERLPKIHMNSAQRGGAVAVSGGARVDLYEGWLTQNAATLEGAAFWIADGGAAGLDTRVTMHGDLAGAPAGAVGCTVREDCNRLRGNLVLDAQGNPGSGVAVAVVATVPGAPSGSAHVRFEGTRIDEGSGASLVVQTSADGHIAFDGALIVDNTLESHMAVTLAPTSSIDFAATTIAGNVLGSGATVLFGPIECSVDSDARGTRVERSIVWQPGHALLTTFGATPASDCFRHLVGHAFAGLTESPERVVADPAFVDVAHGDYRLTAYSPAMDFAPSHFGDFTRDGGLRVFDFGSLGNRFGPQDLGPYEAAPADLIFASGLD